MNQLQPQTEAIIKLINDNEFKTIVEVGVLDGYTADNIRRFCETVEKYYLIDQWKVFESDTKKRNQDIWDVKYVNVCKKFEDDVRFTIIRKPSVEAFELFKPNSIDLVFIDADHSYEYCKQDIYLWHSIVSVGGILCGDDYGRAGVREAVNEAYPKKFSLMKKNRVWVVRKENKT